MAVVEIGFDTREEADAFAMGVEYVNDSSIIIIGKRYSKSRGEHVIVLEDENVHWEEDQDG